MDFDVIIVGGSFAGQAAALQLGRARKRVLLLDAARPRNRFSPASHGFPGQDGASPTEIVCRLSDQLQRYETVAQRSGTAIRAEVSQNGFGLIMEDGDSVWSRKLILASGIRDILPDITGLQARWGVSVLHCPYCHGYELDQQPIGVLGTSENALHQAMLVRDWGPTTLFTQNTLVLTPEQRSALSARDVRIEPTPVIELLGSGRLLNSARLSDGRTVELAGLFVAPRTEIVGDLVSDLGCALDDGPTGAFVSVDAMQRTSVPGVFAAGDVAAAMSNATLSAASGVRAAAAAHQSLIFGTKEAA